jgi:hypothetical protein
MWLRSLVYLLEMNPNRMELEAAEKFSKVCVHDILRGGGINQGKIHAPFFAPMSKVVVVGVTYLDNSPESTSRGAVSDESSTNPPRR